MTENSISQDINAPKLRLNGESKIRLVEGLSHRKYGQNSKNNFSWNETLTYSEKFGQMTYLSQTLLISDITVDYAEYDESMQFRMISNMFPSGEYECPR